MTFKPLTKDKISEIKGYMTNGEYVNAPCTLVIGEDVCSAVEGLKEEVRARFLNERCTDYLDIINKWFPVFVEDSHSLSPDQEVRDLNIPLEKGAATESVANSEGRQQSMATCCRQQSEGSSPSPSNPHSQPNGLEARSRKEP